jgi:hypothetical protein
LKIKAVSIRTRIIAILELDWSTGLGTFRGNWPVLKLGGSKVSIKENFKGKGECANRVVSQDSGGFVNFFIFFARAKGKNSSSPTCKPQFAHRKQSIS